MPKKKKESQPKKETPAAAKNPLDEFIQWLAGNLGGFGVSDSASTARSIFQLTCGNESLFRSRLRSVIVEAKTAGAGEPARVDRFVEKAADKFACFGLVDRSKPVDGSECGQKSSSRSEKLPTTDNNQRSDLKSPNRQDGNENFYDQPKPPQYYARKRINLSLDATTLSKELVVLFPGRRLCECQCTKHKLVNNCLYCGRVVCEQEGEGPCFYCNNHVQHHQLGPRPLADARQAFAVPTLKENRLVATGTAASAGRRNESLYEAEKRRDQLLGYQEASAQRTQVIDDQCDFFEINDRFLSEDERQIAKEREMAEKKKLYGSRSEKRYLLDIAGQNLIVE